MDLRKKEELLKLKEGIRAQELALAGPTVVQNKDKDLDAGEGDECVEAGNKGVGVVQQPLLAPLNLS